MISFYHLNTKYFEFVENILSNGKLLVFFQNICKKIQIFKNVINILETPFKIDIEGHDVI